MSHFQIVTANEWDMESHALIEPGCEHPGVVWAWIEAFGPWPADTFALVVRSHSGARRKESLPLGRTSLRGYDSLVFGFRLPKGTWTLELHSANSAAAVATRVVEIT